MADRKTSELAPLTAPAAGDLLPVVDISEAALANKNKSITLAELFRGVPSGTAAAPSITIEGDENTGLFSPAADTFAVSTTGAERLRISPDGAVGLAGANYGTAGQVLTSAGSAALPTWTSVSTGGGGDVVLASNNAFTGANTFTNTTGQLFRQTTTQDGILLRGRAGGTTSLRVEIVPTTLTANRTLIAPNVDGTLLISGGALGTPSSGTLANCTFPTLNQNTTGTAANVTGTVAIANGGTAATTAPAARTNLGATTLGSNIFTIPNPSAIRFPRFNADNTISALSDTDFKTALGITGGGALSIVDADVNAAANIQSTKLSFTQTGTGATARTIDTRLKDTISVKDFGAVGNGVTNNYTAFVNAITAASGKALYVPSGTYLISLPNPGSVSATPSIGTLQNITIYGDGSNSFLDIRTTGSTYLNVFTLRSNTVLESLKIKLTLFSAQSSSLFSIPASLITSGVTIKNCELFTNYTEGSFIQESYLVNINNSATQVNDFIIDGCSVHNWLYTILKTNSGTSNDSRWTVTNSRFYDNATSHLSINSPLGSHDGFIISNNIFNTVTKNVAGDHHLIGLASVKNCVISSNMFKGLTPGDCIHIEENSDFVTVQGNVIEIGELNNTTTWGDGIRVLDNNISGTRHIPSNISIVGNTVRRTGTRGGTGIAFQWDGPDINAEFVTCANNVVDGFDVGILVDGVSDTIRINGNVVRSCNQGIYMPGSGNPQIAYNSLISCVIGLFGQGLVGPNHFITTTTEVQSSPAGTLSVTGWNVQRKALTLINGNTTVQIMRAGPQLQGRMKLTIGSSANIATIFIAVTYDGTTVTATPIFTYQPASIQYVSMSVVSGRLNITVFCNGGLSGAVLRAEFDGHHVFT